MLRSVICVLLVSLYVAVGHDQDERTRLLELQKKWGNDYAFSGISTFAHLPHARCLVQPNIRYDIGIIGVPFDTAVSYRPGARFGPRAIRAASARQNSFRGLNHRAGINPYASWARIIDCGDIPVSPFDNGLALTQMTEGFLELLGHNTAAAVPLPESSPEVNPPADPLHPSHPVLLALGGDHSIALPHMRALKTIHGESLTVVHFDAHLDTWDPRPSYGGGDTPFGPSPQSEFTHGSMFWVAAAERLVSNYSTHLGLRTRLSGTDYGDYEADTSQGWRRFDVDAIDDYGTLGLADVVVKHIGTERPVYLSVDIDVLDPGLAPGTGTPEPGGWTTRELVRVLRGLQDLNVVGADVVEVAPSFDGAGEQTALAAAQVCFELLTSMVGRGRDGNGGVATKMDEGSSDESKEKSRDEL